MGGHGLLEASRRYGKAPRPELILLALNVPKMDRRGILAEIRKCYQPRATSSITEPVDWEEFLSVAKSIDDFWPTKVNLPGEPSK
jgi:two-component system, chemotaxis family, response regulator Rcp1